MADDKVKLIAEFKDRMSGPMKTADGGIQRFGRGAAIAGTAILGMAAAVVALAKKMGDLAADVRDTAADLRTTTDDVQAFNYAFEQTGGSTETFKSAMRGVTTFMRMAETGAAEQTRVLESLGTTYEQLAAMAPEEQFLLLTDRIGAMTDTTTQATTAATLFGARYSQQIIGTLEQTDGTLRRVTQDFKDSDMMIPEEDIVRLGEFSDKWTELETKLNALLAEAIVPMLPVIEDMGEKFITVATDALPQLIQAVSDSMPVIMGLIDAAELVAAGWGKIAGSDTQTEIDRTAEALNLLASSLENNVAAGMMTAAEAAQTYKTESDKLFESYGGNAIETAILRSETDKMAISFNLAQAALHELLGSMDVSDAISGVGGAFDTIGNNLLDISLGAGSLRDIIAEISSIELPPTPGTISDTDAEETLEKLNTFKDRQIANLEAIAAIEQAMAETQSAKQREIALSRHANIRNERAERLANEIEIANRRKRLEQQIMGIGKNGATEIGRILIDKGEDWETQMMTAIGQMILKMAAIQIGGPIGAVFGFVSSLFQQGTPSIPHAQGGWQTPTGLYGDRFPVMVEGGEEVVSREQRIMNNNYNTSSSDVNLTIAYNPTFSTASPGEMVKFGSAVIHSLRQAGVNLE